MEYWPAIIFGWPAIIGGSALSIAGVCRCHVALTATGCALLVPFCAYVSLNPPPFRWLGILALAGLVACIATLRWRAQRLALASLFPCLAIAVYLGIVVAGQ